MTAGDEEQPGLRRAAQCRFLRTTLAAGAGGDLLNICQHIVRDGMLCVGPFLDDAETDCGLWEYRSRLLPQLRPGDRGGL